MSVPQKHDLLKLPHAGGIRKTRVEEPPELRFLQSSMDGLELSIVYGEAVTIYDSDFVTDGTKILLSDPSMHRSG